MGAFLFFPSVDGYGQKKKKEMMEAESSALSAGMKLKMNVGQNELRPLLFPHPTKTMLTSDQPESCFHADKLFHSGGAVSEGSLEGSLRAAPLVGLHVWWSVLMAAVTLPA